MKTALARRNEWMRQLKRLRDERNRRVDEPEGKFKSDAAVDDLERNTPTARYGQRTKVRRSSF
jgi:hypothetical protein